MIGRVLRQRYRLERFIAGGSMGRVFSATDLSVERSVAVKIMHPRIGGDDPRFLMRFSREASIASQLGHPGIVTIYDFGETDWSQQPYMVMELVPGRSLSDWLQAVHRFPLVRTLDVAIQLARALRAAHRAGVVHRDLKPANVMIHQDEDGIDWVKILDFGLVTVTTDEKSEVSMPYEEQELTRAGTILGSPAYLAPERIVGDPVDRRSDIYALGVLIYEMLTGTPPFDGDEIEQVLAAQVKDAVPPLWQVYPDADVPPELEMIVSRCLEKLPDHRYQKVDALLVALKGVYKDVSGESMLTEVSLSLDLVGPPTEEVEAEVATIDLAAAQPRWWIFWVLILATLVVGGVAAWLATADVEPEAPAEPAPKGYKANPY